MEQLDLALQEFNRQAFYTAHELLELLWHDAYPPDRDFYQGLLQVAAGFYHIQQDNPNGAQILIGEGIYRLQKYPDRYLANPPRSPALYPQCQSRLGEAAIFWCSKGIIHSS